MPLQTAWPVTRRKPAEVEPSQSQEKSPEEHPLYPLELPSDESVKLEKVERILEEVEAGQPTDSRVEIITPRRPRPPLPPRPIHREPEPVEESVQKEQLAEPPAKKPKAKAARAPEMIETGIGPLPSDLWGLIGQPVPQPRAETVPPAAIKPAAPGAEEPAPPSAYLWPEEEESAEAEELAVVQQQAERAEAPAGAAGAAAETGGETSLDDLARQVYREIKKRFAVELERFRRRK